MSALSKHIAFVPARADSEGLPGKNRLLFDYTADFLQEAHLYDEVIVSTNDPVVKEYARKRAFSIHDRKPEFAGPGVSIKQTLLNVIEELELPGDATVWLFYLPEVYKNLEDFKRAKERVIKEQIVSMCAFIPVKTHPYDCWYYDDRKQAMIRYIENDVFRRQDKPPAWEHYHYICCSRVSEVSRLNHELIGPRTVPFWVDEETAGRLIEVDTPENYEKWRQANG